MEGLQQHTDQGSKKTKWLGLSLSDHNDSFSLNKSKTADFIQGQHTDILNTFSDQSTQSELVSSDYLSQHSRYSILLNILKIMVPSFLTLMMTETIWQINIYYVG